MAQVTLAQLAAWWPIVLEYLLLGWLLSSFALLGFVWLGWPMGETRPRPPMRQGAGQARHAYGRQGAARGVACPGPDAPTARRYRRASPLVSGH